MDDLGLNVVGRVGCAKVICLKATVSAIASRILPVTFKPSPIVPVLLCC